MSAKNYLALALCGSSLLFTSVASAQEDTGVGVGAETVVSGGFVGLGDAPGAVTVTYDASVWRAGGMLTMVSYDDWVTYLGIGGFFYYPVHKRHDSDFSVGGGVAILNTDPDGPESETTMHLELGVQLRAFLTRNVAVSARVGLGVLMADDEDPAPNSSAFGLLGQLVGGLGITYFFW